MHTHVAEDAATYRRASNNNFTGLFQEVIGDDPAADPTQVVITADHQLAKFSAVSRRTDNPHKYRVSSVDFSLAKVNDKNQVLVV